MKLREMPLGIYEKSICFQQSWEDKLQLVADAGYDFLELTVDYTKERMKVLFDKEEVVKIRRAIDSTGVPMYTMAFTVNRYFPLGSLDPEIRAKGVEYLKNAIDCAFAVGIRLIHIAAYDNAENPGDVLSGAHFRDSVARVVEYASIRGVIIAFETMDSVFMDSTKKIMEYVQAFNSPYLQAVSDIGNITAQGNNPVTDMPCGGRHVVAIHIKDTRPGQLRDVFFGEGTVDFDACFKTLHEMQFCGILVAEMWCWDNPEFHPKIKVACDFLKAKMANY